MKQNLCCLFAFILALSLNLCFAPFNFLVLLPVIFFFVLSLAYQKDLNKFLLGWFFGFGENFLNLYWLNQDFLPNLNYHSLTMIYINFLIITFVCCFTGLMFHLFDKINSSHYSDLLIFSLLWIINEYSKTNFFTKFSWNFLGYTLGEFNNLAQIADIVGIYGLSFLTSFISGNFYFLWRYPEKIKIYFFIIVLPISIYLYGIKNIDHNLQFSKELVRLVQPNINRKITSDASQKHQNLMKLLDLSQRNIPNDLQLIIWPESSVDYQIEDPFFRNLIHRILPENANLILGNLRISHKHFYNCLYLLNNYGKIINYYDQAFLTIFEKYVNLNPLIHNYTEKTSQKFLKTSDYNHNYRNKSFSHILFSLNSEITSTEAIFRLFQGQKWLLNLADDHYFGDQKIFYHQILAMAKLRSIEFGLPLVRVSNNGISGIFDSYGRKIVQTEINQSNVVDHYIPKNTKTTLYSKIGPDRIIILASILLLFFILRKFIYLS